MYNKDEKIYLKYKQAYYNGTPLVSDEVFDALEDKIKKENPNSKVLTIVGAAPDNYLIKHDIPMLSLQKTYNVDELFNWAAGHQVCCSLKLDGIAVSLVFMKGRGLVLAKTRGDGIFGKNITQNISHMNIPNLDMNMEIRGEVVITKDNFDLLTKEYIKLNSTPPTSMRNAVAGLLNPNKKHDIHLSSYLSFFAYDMVSDCIQSDSNMFKQLVLEGFNTPYIDTFKVGNDSELLLQRINNYKIHKNDLSYQTDGLVFSIDDREIQKSMGFTSHHPKGKMAFKLKNEQGITTIVDIKCDVGKNGKISFVADVKPIELSGAVITKVTLHNANYIVENDIRIGSEINIIRSGEVIPKFLSIHNNPAGSIPFILPDNCPVCGGVLVSSNSGVDLICINPGCKGQTLRQIIHWCKTIGIDGVGEGILSYLFEIKLIENYKDLYKLTIDDIKNLPGFGESSAVNIINAIQMVKAIDSFKFITALSIDGIGKGTSKDLLKYYGNLEKLLENAKYIVNHYEDMPGIGLATAAAVRKNLAYIALEYENLTELGFIFIDHNNQPQSTQKKTFCVTGTLSKNRNDIHKDIENKGHEVRTSVSKDLDYLVCNDSYTRTSKLKSALKYGVKIISENDLYIILSGD